MNIAIITVFAVLNIAVAVDSYHRGNYKTAIFNGFVGGFCLATAIGLIMN